MFKKPENWDSAKLVLMDSNIVSTLGSFDPMSVSDKVWATCYNKYITKREMFDLDMLRKKAVAVVSIASWIDNMYIYYIKKKEVIPLEKDLREAEEEDAVVTMDLNKK